MLRAAYRPPYDVAAMLQFFATRQIEGVEHVDLAQQTLTRTLAITPAGSSKPLQGWVQACFIPDSCNVSLRISASLGPALPTVLARLRAWLDLDADPQAINALLLADFPGTEGLRVPGTLDGFELAVRAVLGQQITVAAARTLGTRLVARYGEPLVAPTGSWAAKRSAPCDPPLCGLLLYLRRTHCHPASFPASAAFSPVPPRWPHWTPTCSANLASSNNAKKPFKPSPKR